MFLENFPKSSKIELLKGEQSVNNQIQHILSLPKEKLHSIPVDSCYRKTGLASTKCTDV